MTPDQPAGAAPEPTIPTGEASQPPPVTSAPLADHAPATAEDAAQLASEPTASASPLADAAPQPATDAVRPATDRAARRPLTDDPTQYDSMTPPLVAVVEEGQVLADQAPDDGETPPLDEAPSTALEAVTVDGTATERVARTAAGDKDAEKAAKKDAQKDGRKQEKSPTGTFPRPIIDPALATPLPAPGTVQAQALLDLATHQSLIGWVWYPGRPQRVATVSVLSEGRILATVKADAAHPTFHTGDGIQHGFVLALPEGTRLTSIELRDAADGTAVAVRSLRLPSSATAPQPSAEVRHLEAVVDGLRQRLEALHHAVLTTPRHVVIADPVGEAKVREAAAAAFRTSGPGPIDIELQPLAQVQAVGRHGARWWRSLGGDPSFTITNWIPAPGWHVIDLTCTFASGAIEPTLYFDWGSGFTGEGLARWLIGSNYPSQRVVYFADVPRAIRFDPTERPMDVRIERFTVRRADAAQVRKLLIAKVLAGIPRGYVSKAEVAAVKVLRGGGSAAAWYPLYERCCDRNNLPVPAEYHDDTPPKWRSDLLTWIRPAHPRLRPLSQLATVDHEGVEWWRSTGDDPWFGVDWVPSKGWHLIDLELDFAGGWVEPTLYFDWGIGIEDKGAVRWLAYPGKPSKRLIYFKTTPHRVRFDPVERSMDFRVTHFTVRRVSEGFVRSRLIAKVDSGVSRGLLNLAEVAAVRNRAGGGTVHEWYPLYNRCFTRPIVGGYQRWITSNEAIERERLRRARTEILAATPELTFDILVPVYNTVPEQLAAMVASVEAQSYTRWRLVLVDDGSPAAATKTALAAVAKRDPRIVTHRMAANGGIAAASQEALKLAVSPWVALLDHDDLLHPDALLWAAEAIAAEPKLKVIYTDEDKVIEGSDRHEPFFKPDYNYDLLLSQNYIGHLLLARRTAMLDCGGFRQGYDGSQDHDLVLRLFGAAKPEEIRHLPWVTYHWRASATSTASNSAAKPYARLAGIKAVTEHLRGRGIADAQVEEGKFPNTFRVRWPLPDPAPLVSLIVPTRDGGQVLARCLEGILEKTDYPAIELLIVDNQSRTDETKKLLAKAAGDKRVKLLPFDAAFNYSAINNFAASKASGTLVGLVNDDIEILDGGWLKEMVSLALRPEVGCVGAKLVYPDKTIQHAGVVIGLGGVAGHSHKHYNPDHPGYFRRLYLTHEVSAVTAACLIIRKAVFDEVKGLDEKNLSVAFNDVDFCLRVREAGYRNIVTPWVDLIHHESKTRGSDQEGEKLKRFQGEVRYMATRWAKELAAGDPMYSPNLTRDREDYGVA